MNSGKLFLIASAGLLLMASCHHSVTTETTVHPDGRLDKVFIFEGDDSSRNVVGIQRRDGWSKSVSIQDTTITKSHEKTYETIFKRSFANADEANQELGTRSDSLLRYTSTFAREFRWFYTDIRYSETIHSLNNLRMKPDDYLVQEDYAFIDRLPAEGKPMSKADKYYLEELNKRIYEGYGFRAYFEEYMDMGKQLLTEQSVEKRWMDTLDVHKEQLYSVLAARKDMEDLYFLDVADSLGVPLNRQAVTAEFKKRNDKLTRKLNFISTASDGKYKHIIHMPWSVVESNADSVAGNSLYWSPPWIKFLLKDYTMHGRSRSPNYEIWALSGAVILFTVYLLIRAGRKIA